MIKRIASKTAEAVFSVTVATAFSAVLNCLLGHPAPVSAAVPAKDSCAFRNVKLPCAREWFRLEAR